VNAPSLALFLPRLKITSLVEQTVDGAKQMECGFTAARYFGSAPGVESTSLQIVDTQVT
jgi:hypothetical protein